MPIFFPLVFYALSPLSCFKTLISLSSLYGLLGPPTLPPSCEWRPPDSFPDSLLSFPPFFSYLWIILSAKINVAISSVLGHRDTCFCPICLMSEQTPHFYGLTYPCRCPAMSSSSAKPEQNGQMSLNLFSCPLLHMQYLLSLVTYTYSWSLTSRPYLNFADSAMHG